MYTILVSACLLGNNCKYNGTNNKNNKIINFINKYNAKVIEVCPETMGGLSTPRIPSEVTASRKVINREGIDVTSFFEKGANKSLIIAQQHHIDFAILMSRSPSCGIGKIYNGKFNHELIDGNGIFAQLLIDNKFKVYDQETFDESDVISDFPML